MGLYEMRQFFGRIEQNRCVGTGRTYPGTFYKAIHLAIENGLKPKPDDRRLFIKLLSPRRIGVAKVSYLEDHIIDEIALGGDFEIDGEVFRAAIESMGKQSDNRIHLGVYALSPDYLSLICGVIKKYIHEKNPLNGKIIDIYGNELDFGNLGWKDIAIPGYFKKEVLQNIIWPFEQYKKMKAANLEKPRGVMLEGNRGMGKTLLGKIIANQIKSKGTFIKVLPSDIEELGWDYVFEVAGVLEPSLLYIEDIDTFTPTIGTPDINAFLSKLLDYLDGMKERGKVNILASTNDPASIDPRLIDRPGRIDRGLVFDPTDKDYFGCEWQKKVLEIHLEGFRLEQNLTIDGIATLIKDKPYTGSHIGEFLHTAGLEALAREKIEEATLKKIKEIELTKADFENALPRVKIETNSKP